MRELLATAVTAVGLAFGAASCDVLPGRQVPERLPSGARVEGPRGGADWWAWLDGDGRRRGRYQVVRSTISFSASHLAPLGTDADARRIFWAPLDRTLAGVTRRAGSRRSAPVRVMAPNG